MATFKIRMKLEGLELEVEGEREDVALINDSLAQQFAGLLAPASAIIEGEIVDNARSARPADAHAVIPPRPGKRKPRKKQAAPKVATTSAPDVAVDWKHDASLFGTPRQEWNTATKSLWTLYVTKEAAHVEQLSAARIAVTFNKHFKQSGTIRAHNVQRDLGKLKASGGQKAQVGEDTTVEPSEWFLTDAGIAAVQHRLAADGADK